MNFNARGPYFILGIVLLWRVSLLVFTAQPIPANDAFGYDGAVVHYLQTGHYFNPPLALVFPISGQQVFSMYPPGYQAVLLPWMETFGTSVISAMALHLVLFALAAWLTVVMVQKYFPSGGGYALAAWLLFGFTFGDRPEDLAYVFGLASLWLVLRQISNINKSGANAGGIVVLLLLTLYTSPIPGAYFFGVGFLASGMAWCRQRRAVLIIPFVVAAAAFVFITWLIAWKEPLWWAGFMESSRQQSVVTSGLHAPHLLDLMKLVRTVPVFLLALLMLPWIVARRRNLREFAGGNEAWFYLLAGIMVAGWGLLLADLTLLAANYVTYVLFTQVMLAAGLIALAPKIFPGREKRLRCVLVFCVVLVSVRAIGMTTWGAACAVKNSYWRTQETLHSELQPFTKTNTPVLVSSAYLYSAAEFKVGNAIDCGWYFDHAHWMNNAEMNALIRLKPAKLVVTQFDYYRSFAPLVEELRARPELVAVTVRDQAAVPTPDSIPPLRRVVQHISWAPVIVDLDWK